MQKGPMFIIISVAAKVIDRTLMLCKWGVVKDSYLQTRLDRTSDPVFTSEVFHPIQVILSLNLGDHEGFTLFVLRWLLKRTLLIVLPVILIQILIQAFLNPVPIFCWVHPRTSGCLPGSCWHNARPRSTQFWEAQYQFCIYCTSPIISIISKAVLISSL